MAPTTSDDDTLTEQHDGEPFAPEERRRLRRLLLEAERASWARKKLMVLVPVVTSLVVGLWQLWSWIEKHLKVVP